MIGRRPRRRAPHEGPSPAQGAPADLWIFGYGSLVWKPAIPFVEQRPGIVRGWARRFWQGSTDHRGVPGAPGRVVTLTQEPTATLTGMAYRVGAGDRDAVLARLDHREKGGYDRALVRVLGVADDTPFAEALLYLATPDNPNWLGPAPLEAIAAQVRRSRGPSGPNDEYVLRLAEALGRLGPPDPHVRAVARLVEGRTGPQDGSPGSTPPSAFSQPSRTP